MLLVAGCLGAGAGLLGLRDDVVPVLVLVLVLMLVLVLPLCLC